MKTAAINTELAALEAAIPDGYDFPADGKWPAVRLVNPEPSAVAPLHTRQFRLGDGKGTVVELQTALLQVFIPGLSPAPALRLSVERPDILAKAWELAGLVGRPAVPGAAVARLGLPEDAVDAEDGETPQPVNPS